MSKLIEKKPEDRFQSAAEVAEVLRQQLAIENQRPPADAGATAERTGSGPSWPGRFLGSRRAHVVGLAAAILASLVGWWATRPGLTEVHSLLSGLPTSETVKSPPRTITVSRSQDGHHRTIKAAMDEATPGSTIRILDDAMYNEAVVIAAPGRLEGVTIESRARATLKPPSGGDGPHLHQGHAGRDRARPSTCLLDRPARRIARGGARRSHSREPGHRATRPIAAGRRLRHGGHPRVAGPADPPFRSEGGRRLPGPGHHRQDRRHARRVDPGGRLPVQGCRRSWWCCTAQ